MRNVFTEGSTWAGVALIVQGLTQVLVAKDFTSGIPSIFGGVLAVFHQG